MSNNGQRDSTIASVLSALQQAVKGSEYARSFRTILIGTRTRDVGGESASDRSLDGLLIDVQVMPQPASDSRHQDSGNSPSVSLKEGGVDLNGLNDRNAFVRLFASSTRYDESAQDVVLNALIDSVVEHLGDDDNPELEMIVELPLPNSLLSRARASADTSSLIEGKSRSDWLSVMRDRDSKRIMASEIIEQALGRVLSCLTPNDGLHHQLRPVSIQHNALLGSGLCFEHYISTDQRGNRNGSAPVALAGLVPLETNTVGYLTRLSNSMGQRMADSRTRAYWKAQIEDEIRNVARQNAGDEGSDEGREEDDMQTDQDFVFVRRFRLYLDPQEQ